MGKILDSLAVGTGKGGTGKTSTATALAAVWAEQGRRVLLVDCDVQGSASRLMDVAPEDSGQGRGLLDAVARGDDLPVFESPGRPGVGVVPAGLETRMLKTHLVADPDGVRRFVEVFSRVESRWDVKLFDLPPTVMGDPLSETVLRASEFVLAPCSGQSDDIEGLRGLGDMAAELDAECVLLGVAMVRMPAAATRRLAEAVAVVEGLLGGEAKVFGSWVRSAEAAVNAARQAGMLPHEFARSVEARRWGMPRNAVALGADFEALAEEVWTELRELAGLLHQPEGAAA